MWCRGKCLLINFRNWFPTFVETFLLYGGLNQIIFFWRRLVSLFLLLTDFSYVNWWLYPDFFISGFFYIIVFIFLYFYFLLFLFFYIFIFFISGFFYIRIFLYYCFLYPDFFISGLFLLLIDFSYVNWWLYPDFFRAS